MLFVPTRHLIHEKTRGTWERYLWRLKRSYLEKIHTAIGRKKNCEMSLIWQIHPGTYLFKKSWNPDCKIYALFLITGNELQLQCSIYSLKVIFTLKVNICTSRWLHVSNFQNLPSKFLRKTERIEFSIAWSFQKILIFEQKTNVRKKIQRLSQHWKSAISQENTYAGMTWLPLQ